MMSTVGTCQNVRLTGYILKVSTRLFQCRSAEVHGHETVGLDLGGHRQVCGSDTQENLIEVVCKRIQNEEAR